ncbi:MAG: hypothetical protein NC213_01110 [Acetobacter sp.]|nr:hypothetical protein [Bacteroides sp.]MCM1340325.1 hypothetical protein [Acetobacter sp.]MCM1433028.1 hypothetical protein [Clostridiales bacterium]
MFRLESKILQREFKVHEGTLYASQIRNTLSKMDFIPDGNSVEFSFHFTDGTEFSSKGLTVAEEQQEDGKLSFTFNECEGITVTMSFWAGEDGNTLKKQISFVQNNTKVIDYIMLEHIGIINSTAHFCVPMDIEGTELSGYHSALGQPFYIDSLFFGCEFPATENNIVYGIGHVKYYLGKVIDGRYDCPVTVVGGAKSSMLVDVQKAFYDYIDCIAAPNDFRLQYNSWYDHMLNIDADNIERSFFEIEKHLSKCGVPPIDAYVIDDGWNNYKSSFWSFNKKFPNKLYDVTQMTNQLNSSFGLWLGPRGGYNFQDKFAKRIEKNGLGAYNAQARDICIADQVYQENAGKFLVSTTKEFDINYWKLDGFCLKPCTSDKHQHITGGENDMYYFTEMWQGWIEILKKIRAVRNTIGKDIWINMTCYVNPSPWWLQYVNSIWLQNSSDIGFAKNQEKQTQADAEITYRDGRYYNLLCTRAVQLPQKYIYNHEPIYGSCAKVNYTDEEFEKYLYFNACRGQALNELHLSYSMMNKSKWRILSNVINWQKQNFDILKNSKFIGGNPEENNIYGYFSWNEDGNGVIALRNPTDEKTALTLTLNKLMGCPEDMKNIHRYNVFNEAKENFDSYSYNDKIDITLKPFEIKVIQFGKEDRRYYPEATTDFTISFDYHGEKDIDIAENENIKIAVKNGRVFAKCDTCELSSDTIIDGNEHKITIVREKNMLLKLYIDRHLDCSGYNKEAKKKVSLTFDSNSENITVFEKATPYDEIITLKEILSKSGRRRNK